MTSSWLVESVKELKKVIHKFRTAGGITYANNENNLDVHLKTSILTFTFQTNYYYINRNALNLIKKEGYERKNTHSNTTKPIIGLYSSSPYWQNVAVHLFFLN